MRFFQHKNLWFAALGLSTFLAFFFLRPLDVPTHRIITADGLGYYSYLPAKFIYHDQDLNFKWFDTVFNRNYDNHFFEKPTDNFMVNFHERKINKYYPGQSLLQLPFFIIAHFSAILFNYPADGFSLPYQAGMGIAAIFYTLLGLFFCHKLLFKLFDNNAIAILVTVLIFFGSNLFTYTIFIGCYSHCYSFCFITLTYYCANSFFNNDTKKLKWFLLTMLFSVIVLTIRPLNAVLLIGIFYFYKPFSLKDFSLKLEKKWAICGLIILLVAFYSLNIIFKQTGSLMMNTYVGEKFYFNDWRHITDNLFGFQYGMLWYTPIILIGISSVFFAGKYPRILFLVLPLIVLVMLYSFWWYWSILTRVIVDSMVIVAILLAYLLAHVQKNKRVFRLVTIAAFISVPFFQLKAFQLRHNILDNNYTYAKYYFKHFFTLRTVNVFPVNPKTVIQSEDHFQDYESQEGPGITVNKSFEGKNSAMLNSQNEFACTSTFTVPLILNKEGFKKIRVAFWMYSSGAIKNIHLVFKFDRQDSSLHYIPFYIGEKQRRDKWDYNEFGIDMPADVRVGDKFSVYFWNPDHASEAFIDNFKVEFFLTNGTQEITLK